MLSCGGLRTLAFSICSAARRPEDGVPPSGGPRLGAWSVHAFVRRLRTLGFKSAAPPAPRGWGLAVRRAEAGSTVRSCFRAAVAGPWLFNLPRRSAPRGWGPAVRRAEAGSTVRSCFRDAVAGPWLFNLPRRSAPRGWGPALRRAEAGSTGRSCFRAAVAGRGFLICRTAGRPEDGSWFLYCLCPGGAVCARWRCVRARVRPTWDFYEHGYFMESTPDPPPARCRKRFATAGETGVAPSRDPVLVTPGRDSPPPGCRRGLLRKSATARRRQTRPMRQTPGLARRRQTRRRRSGLCDRSASIASF
jgi:hypothetical protein